MLRRLRSDPLDPADMADDDLRRKVFREYGRDLSSSIKGGRLTDRPGEIARLMEKAFKAGLAAGTARGAVPVAPTRVRSAKTSRDLQEIDVPSFAEPALMILRFAATDYDYDTRRGTRVTNPLGLVAFFEPHDRSDPRSPRTGRWLVGGREVGREAISGKGMSFFVKAGLVHVSDAGDHWKVGQVTQWGLEFLCTGRTAAPDARKGPPGAFADEWRRAREQDPLRKAAIQLGILAD